ncbi:hypothetical protein FRZ67_09005 [Panacibacter ginsenosidivorans]|uniref:Uncharacterized protein n=1 Tax=Panacibacter ginsenosidivorans TaxID=1813871 RepID=A0A5B8VAU8_9BACT|nr:hypothetical protein [Panacibacter ginsenosidivorans]QEC67428.1 hypothetical protein FRZ67_09005 [Panacibacter ginsenosidivorans]
MKKCLFVVLLFVFFKPMFAQQLVSNTLFSPVTTKQARAERYKYLVDTTIKQYLAEPLNDDNEGLWNEALWSIELIQYKNAYTKQKLTVAWSKAAQLSEYFQKNLLEATYSLYKTEFKTQVSQLMHSTNSVPVFIRCAEYVLRADSINNKTPITSLIKSKFPSDTSVGLKILQSRLSTKKHTTLPPLIDIFSREFLKNQTVVYSLQRSNRDYAGLVIIRKPDGSFVKDSDGNYFHAAQLARAITAYPFYITNGNSPQGILRWTGFGHSRLLYIGPTTNLQMVMPYESKPAVFFADSTMPDIPWQKEMYASMLPETWKNYNGIYESFFAGAMGRYDVIMHGTTIDPSFYKGQKYFPQTPSLGCLCSYEEWDTTGYRVNSNQQQIADALSGIGSNNGYVVIIDIDNKNTPVTIDEIEKYISIAQNIE